MGTVRSLNPTQGLEEFCDFLYGKETGYVHAPIKNYQSDRYEYNYFFKWPAQREQLLEHVRMYSTSYDVFIAPGMFKEPSSSVVDSHGSYVVWADFDENVPTLQELEEQNIPAPSLCVQSSDVGREHWYWKFDQFNTNVPEIQNINKAIAYALKADVGSWDAGHSLRPVGTLNHKRGKLPVHIIRHRSSTYTNHDFEKVPVPTESYNIEQFRKEHIPNASKVMLKHGPWETESIELLTERKVNKGSRSSALTKLAYMLCEQGLDNSEVYSVLMFKDKTWKKFTDRDDKEKYYVSIINYVRQKVPYEGIKDVVTLSETLKVRSWREVIKYEDPIKWLIEGLLPHQGAAYLVGPSGVGKTTLSLNICANLALGRGIPVGDEEIWSPVEKKPFKILYLSLEMNTGEVQDFISDLDNNFNEEEISVIDQHFFVYSETDAVKFGKNNATLSKFVATVQDLKPDVILVDSASRAISNNLSDQEEVITAIERMEKVRDKLNTAMLVIHHPRKDAPGHGYREAELDDMFGSAFIAASASSIISMKPSKDYKDNGNVNIRYLKTRFRGDNQGFTVRMTNNRSFIKPSIAAIESKPIEKVKKNGSSESSYFSL